MAVSLTKYTALAQRTGLLKQQPGVHTVPVELVQAGQHSQTLDKRKGTNSLKT